MNKTTLFVGDCNNLLALTAIEFNPNAVLINTLNYRQFINTSIKYTGYTSLADLPKDLNVFYTLLTQADKIIYCPPKRWSDKKTVDLENPTDSIQGLTEYYLYVISKNKNNVHGLNLINFNPAPYVKTSHYDTIQKSLWIVGCSTTAGVGVEHNEKYGMLLSKTLNLPAVFLAEPGSSISWAADQILRSNIQTQDIVIWGLTSDDRFCLWNKNVPVHVSLFYTQNHNFNFENFGISKATIKELLLHKTHLVTHIQKIYEAVNFCAKIKANLLIFNIHSSNTLNLYLNNVKEFLPYLNPLNTSIDIGNDQFHPGPKQHQAYADFCHSALKKLQYI